MACFISLPLRCLTVLCGEFLVQSRGANAMKKHSCQTFQNLLSGSICCNLLESSFASKNSCAAKSLFSAVCHLIPWIGKESIGLVDQSLLISVYFVFFPASEQFGGRCACIICEEVKRHSMLIYEKLQCLSDFAYGGG